YLFIYYFNLIYIIFYDFVFLLLHYLTFFSLFFIIFFYSYSTLTKYNPFGGKVFPAFSLFFSFIIFSICCGSIFPSPTSTRVPAIILTILYKNPFPVSSIIILSSFIYICVLYIVLTLLLLLVPLALNALKSCSRSKYFNACSIFLTSNF